MADKGTSVQVIGSDKLSKTLQDAGAQLEDLGTPNRAAGAMVAAVARGLAPRVSGNLAASIGMVAVDGGIAVDASAPYAGPIHWGWPARNIKAQPFLSDAATQTESQWVELYEAEVDKALDRVEGDK